MCRFAAHMDDIFILGWQVVQYYLVFFFSFFFFEEEAPHMCVQNNLVPVIFTEYAHALNVKRIPVLCFIPERCSTQELNVPSLSKTCLKSPTCLQHTNLRAISCTIRQPCYAPYISTHWWIQGKLPGCTGHPLDIFSL
jgi:hypothetical protein